MKLSTTGRYNALQNWWITWSQIHLLKLVSTSKKISPLCHHNIFKFCQCQYTCISLILVLFQLPKQNGCTLCIKKKFVRNDINLDGLTTYSESTLICGLGKKHKSVDSWIHGLDVFRKHISGNLLFIRKQISWLGLLTQTHENWYSMENCFHSIHIFDSYMFIPYMYRICTM